MRILLLTTLPNLVHRSLLASREVEATVIDFSTGMSKQTLHEKLKEILCLNSYHILLTYRCPYIISKDIFSQFKVRLNIHPLPLPEYAGLNPWDAFLRSGHKQAEAVLHHIVERPDAGEIILKEPYTISDSLTARDDADSAASTLIIKALNSLTQQLTQK